jgi:hypothetical protein
VAIPVNRILNGEIGDPTMNVMRVVSLAFLSVALGFGQARQEEKPGEQKPAKPEAGAKSEGIKVHGHWIIDVRNPDGTLAAHHEFDNSLQGSGAQLLVGSLSRTEVAGTWLVQLWGNVCPGNGNCALFEPADPAPATPYSFKTLTFSVPGSGPYAGALMLNGAFTAPLSGAISMVATSLNVCFTNVLQVNCNSSNVVNQAVPNVTLTSANYGAAVTAGQSVLVTVVISFM